MERLERRTLLAAADLDPTFGSGGKATLSEVGSSDEYVRVIAPVGDGRLLVGGHRETGQQPDDRFGSVGNSGVLARYLPDGRPDPTFGAGGKVLLPDPWLFGVQAVAAFPDGSSIVAGGEGVFGLTKLLKLTPSGSIDP